MGEGLPKCSNHNKLRERPVPNSRTWRSHSRSSQNPASSRKTATIISIEDEGERYLIDLPYTEFTKGGSP
jgi:hypothetical protein